MPKKNTGTTKTTRVRNAALPRTRGAPRQKTKAAARTSTGVHGGAWAGTGMKSGGWVEAKTSRKVGRTKRTTVEAFARSDFEEGRKPVQKAGVRARFKF